MTDDLNKWKREHSANIEQELGTDEGLHKYIATTLNNFIHRYIKTDYTPEVELQIPQNGFFLAEGEERDMLKVALTENQNILKAISQNDISAIRYILMVSVAEFNGKAGKINLVAVAHWGAPDFLPQSPKQDIKKLLYTFNDVMDFRNNFAKYIEEVCEVF